MTAPLQSYPFTMKRTLNFGAGPAILPLSVLSQASKAVLEIDGSGMSILEISHRGDLYEQIHNETKERILKLLELPTESYTVLFLGGGASLQFSMVPMNLLRPGDTADYVNTGEWSTKAINEAKRYGNINVAASSELEKFSSIPTQFEFSEKARYCHLTLNNTIEGTQWNCLPQTKRVPLVGDLSSELFSRKLDFARFGVIYAGAQKNAGPAGVTVVIIRKEMLTGIPSDLPTMLSYQTHAKGNSLYNTPPVFAIYVMGLVCQWIEEQGGIGGMEKQNEEKARLIYGALDSREDLFETVVKRREDRSRMNITFRLKDANHEKIFLKRTGELGMEGLKGHRSVGGLRASIYNAFPLEGAKLLSQFVMEFRV
jgi:phosphoserine aminotransferase